MAVLGLRQAAQQAGVSKSTILRAIRAGRLSAARTEDGGYAIDPAELFRVYPPHVAAQRSARQGVGQGVPDDATGVTASAEVISRVAVEAELVGARQLIAFLKTQVDDLRSDRDGWRQQAEATQRLLAYVQEKPKPDTERPYAGVQAGEQPYRTNTVERSYEGDHQLRDREPSEEDEQTPERAMAQIRAGLLSYVQESAKQESLPLAERRPWWKRLAASFA